MSRHKKEADEIVRIAKAANDTSTEAYQLLLKTLAGENQTANDIDELNQKWVSNRKLFLFPGLRAVLKTKTPSVALYALGFMGVVFQFLSLSTLLVSSVLQKKLERNWILGVF